VRLIERDPRVQTAASGGIVYIILEGPSAHDEKEIRDLLEQTPGMKRVEFNPHPLLTPD
jgi:hypothetical protein